MGAVPRLLCPCPHEGRGRGCSRGIPRANSNGLQFIAGEAQCPFPLPPFTVRKKGTFFVSRQGFVRLVDRPRSETGHDPLRHRLVFLGLYVRAVEEAIGSRSGIRAATRRNHLCVSPTGVEALPVFLEIFEGGTQDSAIATACTRLLAPSLRIAAARYARTVRSEMRRCAATFPVGVPFAKQRSTSSSRLVSVCELAIGTPP